VSGLTKRAVDLRESPRFRSIFLLSGIFPARRPLTHTVSSLIETADEQPVVEVRGILRSRVGADQAGVVET